MGKDGECPQSRERIVLVSTSSPAINGEEEKMTLRIFNRILIFFGRQVLCYCCYKKTLHNCNEDLENISQVDIPKWV